MGKDGPASGRRLRAYAYTLVTTAIVLIFALAEWGAEKYVADRSRAAGVALEVAIVVIAALVFRPIHLRVEKAVDQAFYKRKRQALAALAKFRRELSSFNDMQQLLRRVIEAVEQHLEAHACAVYLRRELFRAEASSFDVAAGDVDLDDPLVIRLRSSGAPAQPPLLRSTARGTHAFPMTAAGDLIGFLLVHCRQGYYDDEEAQMLTGLAQDLAVALVALDPRLRPRRASLPNNIPADLPAIIGRERELHEITAALDQSRLVTLVGPGGVGKTCIALHCAAEAISQHEDGAWFVNLAPLSDGNLIASTILGAMGAAGAREDGDLQQLLEYLKPRDALIVLDNCEQIIADVAKIVARVGAACPQVTLLATSREMLHLGGEQVYRLGALRIDAAIDLFCKRSADVSAPSDKDMEAIRAICEHLDGIPLAIELAAARTRALSAREILDHLNERFRLLTSSARGELGRHQTLAATIQWSYGLLAPEEQSLFARLGTFRGSFSLPAAVAVCAQDGNCDEYHVLDVLTSLADKSLLTARIGLTTRYQLLETIREFASGKALERRAVEVAQRQHAAYFAALAAQAYHEFDTRLPEAWLARLVPDIDNFRAALVFALEGPGDRRMGAQLGADCGPMFLRLQLLSEGLRWCDAARAVQDLSPATAGRIAYVAAMMHNNLGAYPAALACAQRAVAFYENSTDERGLIRALSQLAQQYAGAKRFDEAQSPAERAIQHARQSNDPRLLVAVLRRCATSLPTTEIERARTLFSEALETARVANDPEEIGRVLDWWAAREAAAGSLQAAIDLSKEGLAYADRTDQMYPEAHIASWYLALGNVNEAAPHARRMLTIAVETRHPLAIAFGIAYCSAAHARHDSREAAMLYGFAKARLEQLDWRLESDEELAMQTVANVLASALDAADLSDPIQRGARISQEEALTMLSPTLARNGEDVDAALPARDGVGTLLR